MQKYYRKKDCRHIAFIHVQTQNYYRKEEYGYFREFNYFNDYLQNVYGLKITSIMRNDNSYCRDAVYKTSKKYFTLKSLYNEIQKEIYNEVYSSNRERIIISTKEDKIYELMKNLK